VDDWDVTSRCIHWAAVYYYYRTSDFAAQHHFNITIKSVPLLLMFEIQHLCQSARAHLAYTRTETSPTSSRVEEYKDKEMDTLSKIDPSIAEFLTRFFEVSDISPTCTASSASDTDVRAGPITGGGTDAAKTEEIHGKWVSFFREDATLIMGSENACGLDGGYIDVFPALCPRP